MVRHYLRVVSIRQALKINGNKYAFKLKNIHFVHSAHLFPTDLLTPKNTGTL